jgi:hypothetical protein
MAQIMEAKYYRGGNFLDSSLGNQSSFAWRSIHGSQELLKEGLVWRIGNGLKTRIWKDRWLPRPSTFMIQSPPSLLNSDAIVSEIIDEDTRWWKTQLLETLFSDEEVQLILSLPVSSTNREDVCIWRGTKNGNFSVRSAYYLQVELDNRGLADSSSSKDYYLVWRKIWGLEIPKVEKNLWRACHEILPTRKNLKRRNITEDPLCPISGLEEETALHILWECPSARDAWGVGVQNSKKAQALV